MIETLRKYREITLKYGKVLNHNTQEMVYVKTAINSYINGEDGVSFTPGFYTVGKIERVLKELGFNVARVGKKGIRVDHTKEPEGDRMEMPKADDDLIEFVKGEQ